MHVRKIVIVQETVFGDETGVPIAPAMRVAGLAVVTNPAVGRALEDLTPLFKMGAALGERLAGEVLASLKGTPVAYGKAAIVGTAGIMEHGAAVLHPRLGKPVRAAIGGGEALMPSNVKVAPPGTPIDLPLGHKDAAWSFDHIDTMTLALADAPRADELVLCLALSATARPRARVGKGPGQA